MFPLRRVSTLTVDDPIINSRYHRQYQTAPHHTRVHFHATSVSQNNHTQITRDNPWDVSGDLQLHKMYPAMRSKTAAVTKGGPPDSGDTPRTSGSSPRDGPHMEQPSKYDYHMDYV